MNEEKYCCSDCRIIFKKYKDMAAHRKNDCPKKFKMSSEIPSDVITKPPKSSRHWQMALLRDPTTSATLSCVESLKRRMEIKRMALGACRKANEELECALNAYKEVVQKKRETFKAYYEDRNREKDLTANTKEENMINCQRRSQILSEIEAVLKEEEDEGMRLQRALSIQESAIGANSRATKQAQTALIEAEKLREQIKEQRATATLYSQTEDVFEIEKAAKPLINMLEECKNLEWEYETSVNSTIADAFMVIDTVRDENAIFLMERRTENSIASTSDNEHERLVPDCSRFQQMMDVSKVLVKPSTSNLDMNQSNYFEEEPVYCCSDCHINYKNSEDLEAHGRNDCPKIFKTPSPISSYVVTNPSKSSRQTEVEFLRGPLNPVTLSSIESLKLAMRSKRVALETFRKANEQLKCTSNAYKEAVQKKRDTFKAYYEDRNREKDLTANTEEENLINCQRRPQILSEIEAVLKEEEDEKLRFKRALSIQKTASDANNMATKQIRTALIEAEKWRERIKEQSTPPTLRSRTEDVFLIQKALMPIKITLQEYKNLESEYQYSVNTTVKKILKLQEAERNENAILLLKRKIESSVASTPDSQHERLVPDSCQFQQMMDVSTVSVSNDCSCSFCLIL